MTYFITFCSNNVAQVIESETRNISEKVRDMVVAAGKAEGFKVFVRSEG